MKIVNENTDTVKREETRYKGRLSYYVNKLGLSQEEAVRRAMGGKKPELASDNGQPQPAVSEWKKRQLAKNKGKAQPLKLKECPKCGAKFLITLDGKTLPSPQDKCPNCNVTYYFCEE